MQVSLAVASTHDLRVEVTPNGAGSLNISGGTYESGSSVYLNTYSNNGYVFKGWYNGETLLSSSASFNYKMPAKNVVVQARYEFDPKVPGNPAMPDTTTCYSFTAIVSPYGAGSLSNQKGKYAVGAKVSLHTYGNTGYKFIGWQNEDGTNISTSSSFNYTMPNHDVKLTALYSFDPSVPANPDSMATRYTVAVASKPMGGGSFNSTNVSTEEGNNVHLYAYTNTGYEFLRWENEQGETISTAQDFYFVMPHGNTKIYGVFDFNPAPPSNPSKNYWNKELGEVIVDDFTQGNLENAVSSVINGSDRGAVAMITVSGKMNNNDFGVVNNYSNCTLLDLSRITGINEIPSYAFDYTNLESVYLPATIEKIGYRAFYDCKQLSSLTVYAMVPPSLENDVFKGVQDGLVVYVPASAISQYQDAKGWKDFTILPIQEDIRSVSVSLPASVSAADYAQMWLELTNTKSGQRMHYVMTDRTTYTFANIIRNTSWNVVLRNQRGDVFGKIDNIDVKDEDVSVVFSSLARPQNVVLTIKTPDNTDVTSKAQITWLDSDGNYLSQSTSLSGLHSGSVVSYKVTLSQELAMQYTMPSQKKYVVSEDNNQVMITLEPIKQVTLSGCVKDLATKTALIGATVAVSQTFGGKYSKTMNAKTDAKGFYSLAVGNVPTSLAISASDYISQTIVCDSLMNGSDDISIPDVSLKGISGAVVSVGLNYTKCPTGNGEESVVQEWYADYNNITYSIYNQTKQKAISQFNVQYPQIVLLEEVDEGDILVMTATSKNNSFMPVTATAKVDGEQRANVLFNIIELGKLQATFTKNTNASVVGSLYDAKGKLLKSYDFSNASLTINDLVDGSYTLVTMGGSKLINNIYDLSQLPQTGLVLGSDYTQSSMDVKSGMVCVIDIDEVPPLDESKLYYTGDNTSFTVNKPSIVAGNYLTLTGRIDFKTAYAGNVSNVNLIVDLPESCQFVENSVMVGNSMSSYTLQNNRVMIPLARYTDRVRFCIIPTLGGEYAPSALAQFDIDGKTVIQPIGSAFYTAKDLSISVPSTVAKTTIPVSGTAIGASSVEIYDNGVLIGQTTSLANGTWATTCELNEPYNLSTHAISAKLTTKTGMLLTSETTEVTYNKDNIVAEKVTMLYYNPEMDKEYNIVFDLISGSVTPSSFYFFPYKNWPNWSNSGTEPKDFTFVVDLSNNDAINVKDVTIGVYTKQNTWMNLEATFNEKMGRWTTTHKFEESNLPIGVKVDVDADLPSEIDEKIISNLNSQLSLTVQNGIQLIKEIDSVNADEYTPDQYEEKIMSIVGENCDNSDFLTYDEISSWSDTQLDEQLQTLEEAKYTVEEIEKEISEIRELFSNDKEYICDVGEGIKVISCSCLGLNENDLLELGYEEYITTEGKIYVLRSETKNVFIDLSQDLYIEISNSSTIYAKGISRASGLEGVLDRFNEIIDNINSCYQPIADAYNKTEKLLGKFYLKFEDMSSSAKSELPKAKMRYNMKLVKLEHLEKELASMTTLDANYYLKQLQVDTYRQEVKAAKSILNKLNAKKAFATMAAKLSRPLPGIFKKNIPLIKYANIIYDGVKVVRTFQQLYLAIPDPCENDQSNAKSCKNLCVAAAVFCEGVVLAKAGASALLDFATIGQLAAAAETGGVSALTAIATVIVNIGGNLALDIVSQKEIDRRSNQIRRIKEKLKCEDDKCPRCHKKPCECEKPCPVCNHKPCICCIYCKHYPCTCTFCPKCGKRKQFCTCKPCNKCGRIDCICKPEPTVVPIHDPSGFVYEGVFSNRLEGVTATCYYKKEVEDMYGDLHENIVKWNAEEYAQENPLFTDEKGYYRWDVPQGLWQVKFEKDGYETTYSEWLPVPPPQLDVNIAMKQNVQPNVKNAHAYDDAVEVEFDKYMMPELLNTDNIIVMSGDKQVEGSIKLLDEEVKCEGETETFASKLRFNAKSPFEGSEVTLMINNRVKSYAGIRMQDDYSQSFAIEQEVRKIVCDSATVVGYGSADVISVSVLPASASAGKTLIVHNSSTMILGTDVSSIELDENGKAEIPVIGELPGTAALTFTIDGYDLSATSIINVEQIKYEKTSAPISNIATGTTVNKGTQIELSCKTEGATIYYTLDGSCPCDENGTRFIYDGTPIVINDNVAIKAMAVAPNMDESDVVEFIYAIDPTGIDNVTIDEQVEIYPLPVRELLNVTAGGKMIKHIKITSVNGVVVASSSKSATKMTLNVGMIPAGVYIINVTTESGFFSRKIQKL